MGTFKALYWLVAVCKEWYEALRNFLASLAGEATLLDRSVFFFGRRDLLCMILANVVEESVLGIT